MMNNPSRVFRVLLGAVAVVLPGSGFAAGLNTLVQSSNPVGNGWFHSPWYGYFTASQPGSAAGWILHNEHGWVYIHDTSGSTYSVYDSNAQLTQSFSPDQYPSMYTYGTSGDYWLRYDIGSAPLRWFVVQTGPEAGQWVHLPVAPGPTPDGPNGPVPTWWKAYGLVDLSKGSDNYAYLTVGQLKHVATRAKAYFEQRLQVGQSDWDAAYDAFGGNPFPLDAGTTTSNHTVATIGQLKYLASGFYHLLGQHPDIDLEAFFQIRGLTSGQYSLNPSLPWPAQSPAGANTSPANLGQLKLVFGFDLEGNGFQQPGFWELLKQGTPDADRDLWADGLELFMGLAPGFTTRNQLLARPLDPGFADALAAHLSQFQGTVGPVLVIPDHGLFRVHQHLLSLHPLQSHP